ncbi:MAG: 1,4-dihydroxy-2-naphthoate polyprenyltransferase [Chloroflexi bacterium AL-W]|nr:1,4-dihydroxy-2-naphthoate polyprenyltransferase [Chloroflexi bacterium AL-N1]NOK68228.1 1,4-dihydroxy-2-naphthoate polyprenyltransferase [Chloroflexi bacterium AL-N10]NOK73874.1 1,4-dihydroxy-2-naphthoate polyprenyltransferase [Chloroflexi bacterium AL-N5]NOK82842.1 1,4-dihydroxy-2-naphthoate polyprenyltransferase [Chloroflexi bacterium AL-W]NOK90364.1 1,4-dihydroxy-2-naphthoate polyprenyltransferase [Chloroflexi bacterium AL-N15]
MVTDSSSTHPGIFKAWLMAIRVPTLPAAVVPVLVGTAVAVADGVFRLGPFLAALAASLLIQIGTNLANDYFDNLKGADTAERLGPIRVTQSGLIAPYIIRNMMILTFGLAAVFGLYLILVTGWPILVIGVLSIAAGILYTGGPWPLGYNGLGDLFTFVFFGVVAVVGTTYLHTLTLSTTALVVSLPVAMLVTAILVVNNLRDVNTDRVANKRTLAVLLGEHAVRIEYAVLVLGAYVVVTGAWLLNLISPWSLLVWLTLPLAITQVQLVSTASGRILNRSLKGTAQIHMFFGILFAIGLMI